MGSIRLRISVNDIGTVLMSYDSMKVKRSTTGQNGVYTELTAPLSTHAVLSATLEGPYAIAGKTLQLIRDSHAQVDVLFPGLGDLTPVQAANAINSQVGVVIATVDAGKVILTSTTYGTSSKIIIVGGSAAPYFGWLDNTKVIGLESYITLQAGISLYEFIDNDGEPGYYYKVTYYNTTNGQVSQDSSPFLGAAATLVGADNLSVAVVDLVDGAGVAVAEQEISFYPVHEPLQVDGFQIALTRKPLSVTTDNAGHAEVTLVRGLKVRVVFEGTGLIREIVVPNQSSFDLLTEISTSVDPYDAKTLGLPAAPRRTI